MVSRTNSRTIDRVSGGFSNGGLSNYRAINPPALHGNGAMAVVSGAQDVNQGIGMPRHHADLESGRDVHRPYSLFSTGANVGMDNVFPNNGFTVTDDLYLSASTALPLGSLVDNDIAIDNFRRPVVPTTSPPPAVSPVAP